MKALRGRCPQCCPNGGACFEDMYDGTKKCNNCSFVMPRRRVKKQEGPNATQQRIIAMLIEAFGEGTTLESHMIGRKVWVSLTNENRKWFNGTMLYGTVGPAGAYRLKLPRIFGNDVEIKDAIGVDVYLRSGK